ncbi:MAG: hypothetical protein WC789_10225 [Lentisphaeria bacterium]
MSAKEIDPVARSVHDRLLKLATSRKEDFNAMLGRPTPAHKYHLTGRFWAQRMSGG